MHSARVCLLMVLLLVAVAAAAHLNELYPYKPDKWTKECETIDDCKPCEHGLTTICVGGYCGCKYKYSFGRK